MPSPSSLRLRGQPGSGVRLAFSHGQSCSTSCGARAPTRILTWWMRLWAFRKTSVASPTNTWTQHNPVFAGRASRAWRVSRGPEAHPIVHAEFAEARRRAFDKLSPNGVEQSNANPYQNGAFALACIGLGAADSSAFVAPSRPLACCWLRAHRPQPPGAQLALSPALANLLYLPRMGTNGRTR